jgi:HEPN domain-containing protein
MSGDPGVTIPRPLLPQELLALAREDHAAAMTLAQAEGVSVACIAFHAQQAVARALKAVLVGDGETYLSTQDIGLLLRFCDQAGHETPAILAPAYELTPYATSLLRELGHPASIDPTDALCWAGAAVGWAEQQLR